MSKRSLSSDVRKARSEKLSRPVVLNGSPKSNEGSDGDLTIRRTHTGTNLYIKINGRWREISTTRSERVGPPTNGGGNPTLVAGRENGVAVIKAAYGDSGVTNKQAPFSTPKLLVKDNNGTGVLLKESDGLLNVRSIDDSADGDIQCASIKDSNGNKVVEINAVSNSVNYVKAFGSIASNTYGPTLIAEGSDTNIPITLQGKGTGAIYLSCTSALGINFMIPIAGIKFNFDVVNITQTFYGAANYLGKIHCEADGEFQIFNLDAANANTAAHIKISSCDDLYLSSGGGQIKLSGNGTGQDGSAIDMGTEFGEFDFSTASTCKLKSTTNYDLWLEAQGTGSVNLNTSAVGFTQNEPTFDATDTIITFSTTGNKQKVTLTDNCTDIHFKFPAVSGNFLCVILQDGTGGRTISNWKTQDSAGNAGAGNSGLVLWAGGTAPSNTETASKADIASFYWDADNEIAYGTYTKNF